MNPMPAEVETTKAPQGIVFSRILSHLLIGLVRGYQCTASPVLYALFGRVCRFEPSCSQYFIEAVRKYGPWRGGAKGLWRVCRCNPFCRGGYDPP